MSWLFIDSSCYTLEELADLLRLPAQALETPAAHGPLPGRRIAGEWRFARAAIIEWLAQGEAPRRPGAAAASG